MTSSRVVIVALAGLVVGVAVGRVSTRETHASASTSTRTPTSGAPSCSCHAERVELAVVKAQLGTCLSSARTRADQKATSTGGPASAAPAAAAKPQGMDALLGEMVKLRAEEDSAPELIYVEYRDGRLRSYRPEEWPPEGGIDGGRVIMHKLPDGIWERYDPPPELVRLSGPPGPDGVITEADGRRIRYVFTDGGVP